MISLGLRQTALGAAALTLVASLGACRRDLCAEAAHVNGNYEGECLSKLQYFRERRRVEISPHPECSWQRLIDLSVFEGFRPGMTIEQAREREGAPDVEASDGSRRIWKYRRKKGVVQIAHEDQGSAIIPLHRWWVLRAFPTEGSPHVIFPSEIVERLPAGETRYEVVVLNQCRLPMADIVIEHGKVQLITWIDNPGSYHAGRWPSSWHRSQSRSLPPGGEPEKLLSFRSRSDLRSSLMYFSRGARRPPRSPAGTRVVVDAVGDARALLGRPLDPALHGGVEGSTF